MNTFIDMPVAPLRYRRRMQWLAVGALLAICCIGSAYAETGAMDAKLAIARAQANIDLVSKENPAQTRDQSFADAQARLTEAHTALEHHRDRQAVWYANEAEVLADTTAGAAKLAGLEHVRADAAREVDVLTSDSHK